MQNDDSEDKSLFNLALSPDRDKFLRRTCPSCGRDFKTEIDLADIAWAVTPEFQRVGLEIGVKRDQEVGEPEKIYLHCPYCRHIAETSEMLTEEMMTYIHRHLMREVVLLRVRKAFSSLDDIGKRSGGFISMRIECSRSIDPPRPLHGPEPPDIKIVDLLCCGKKAKVTDNWHQVEECIFCGTKVILI
jgi:hypothetical protein